MKCTIQKYLLFFIMLHQTNICAISIVYSFRIAQITKQPIFEKKDGRNHSLIGLIFDQYQKKHDGIFENFVGGLGSFIYDFKSYYFRADFAVSHIKEITNHIPTFSGTKTDDILFTLGRNFIINDRTTLTLSGLFGIPTHRIFRLQHTDFGYAQIGTGIQFDGSYATNRTSDLLFGARYIHFVPRNALDLLEQKHRFSIGNIIDFLLAYKKDWDNHHGIEFGSTARFQFGARIYPNLDDIVKKTNYIRSEFYLAHKYKFLLKNTSNRLIFYIAYGFDHKPKLFGNKYIVTIWASWNIRF